MPPVPVGALVLRDPRARQAPPAPLVPRDRRVSLVPRVPLGRPVLPGFLVPLALPVLRDRRAFRVRLVLSVLPAQLVPPVPPELTELMVKPVLRAPLVLRVLVVRRVILALRETPVLKVRLVLRVRLVRRADVERRVLSSLSLPFPSGCLGRWGRRGALRVGAA